MQIAINPNILKNLVQKQDNPIEDFRRYSKAYVTVRVETLSFSFSFYYYLFICLFKYNLQETK